MARYSSAFKAKAVARLLPPESAPLDLVSVKIGVRADTLSRWRAEALSDSHDRLWTGPARLEAVIHTASLDEATRSAWCRENGVYPAELEQWRAQASESLSSGVQLSNNSSRVYSGSRIGLVQWSRRCSLRASNQLFDLDRPGQIVTLEIDSGSLITCRCGT